MHSLQSISCTSFYDLSGKKTPPSSISKAKKKHPSNKHLLEAYESKHLCSFVFISIKQTHHLLLIPFLSFNPEVVFLTKFSITVSFFTKKLIFIILHNRRDHISLSIYLERSHKFPYLHFETERAQREMGADWGPVVVAVILFILLSPGLLFQLPARTRVMEFGNMSTSGIAILVHAIIYFCIITILIIAIGIHIHVN